MLGHTVYNAWYVIDGRNYLELTARPVESTQGAPKSRVRTVPSLDSKVCTSIFSALGRQGRWDEAYDLVRRCRWPSRCSIRVR